MVRERLAGLTPDLVFDRGRMQFQALSPAHMRGFLESNAGPVQALAQSLDAETLATFRSELDALIATYFDENIVHQDFLMTRATKV